VLWNGGWDDYLIDPFATRNMTEEELAEAVRNQYSPTVGNGGSWLRCKFLGSDDQVSDTPEAQVVRILEHVAGGD